MEDAIRNRFDPRFVAEAASRFAIDPDAITELDGFESFIYAGQRPEKVVLRLAHSIRRSPELIHAELDFMDHLVRGGAAVCAPIPSRSGELVEALDDAHGGHFLASCFAWARGEPLQRGEHYDEAVLLAYGRAVGQMHRLVQSYAPTQSTWRRPQWDDLLLLDVEGWLEGKQPEIVEIYRALRSETSALPRSPDVFNLIHQDMHMGNFHITPDHHITAFDFDDCAHGFFINDLAIVLYHALRPVKDPEAFTRRFLAPILRGYREEYALDPSWLKHMPLFMALRRVDLYAVIHRSMKAELAEGGKWAAWARDRRAEILAETPVVDLDFYETFSSCLG